MDLQAWITTEHDALRERFEHAIAATVPRERWRDAAGAGGSSIAWLLFHTARHEDLALRTAVNGQAPLLDAWRDRLGLVTAPPDTGLGEAEDPAVVGTLDLDALVAYAGAVHDNTSAWLHRAGLEGFDDVPPASARIAAAGVSNRDVPWLHAMWTAKPVAWFVQWEAVGHRQGHLGEMVSVRSRLGLSPF